MDVEWEAVFGNVHESQLFSRYTFPRRVTVVIPEVWQPVGMTQLELSKMSVFGPDKNPVGTLQEIVDEAFRAMVPRFDDEPGIQRQLLCARVRFASGCILREEQLCEHSVKEIHLTKEEWLISQQLGVDRRRFRGVQLALSAFDTPVAKGMVAVIADHRAERLSHATIQTFSESKRLHCVWDVALELDAKHAPHGLHRYQAHDVVGIPEPTGRPNKPSVTLELTRIAPQDDRSSHPGDAERCNK
jgi:hypothetical protein